MSTPFDDNDIPTFDFDSNQLEIEMSGGTTEEVGDAPVGPQNAFLEGERHYVISSNVEYFQYFELHDDGSQQHVLYVGFKDGSVYSYQDISPDEALIFYQAASAGGAVWDNLRVRGTVFGFKKPYALTEGHRVWNATGIGRVRHGAIPASGEPFQNYHPVLNYKGAKGQLGPKAVDLGRKRSPHKIEVFTPVRNLGSRPPKRKRA